MKRNFTIVFLLFLFACQKEKQLVTLEDPLISSAKSFYDTFRPTKFYQNNVSSKNDVNFNIYEIVKLDWEKATTFKEKQNIIVEVPAQTKFEEGSIMNGENKVVDHNVLTSILFVLRPNSEIFKVLIAKVHFNNREDLVNNKIKSGLLKNKQSNNITLLYNADGTFYRGVKIHNKKISSVLKLKNSQDHKLSASKERIMAAPEDGDCSTETKITGYYRWCEYYTDGTYNNCTPWRANYGTVIVCSSSGGGSDETYTTEIDTLDPYDPNNDLALPCENVDEPNFIDTINVINPIAQEGLKLMLPYQYHAYISFDQRGNLNNSLLQSASSNSSVPASEIYDALVYLTQQSININIYLKPSWFGRTTQDPDGASYSWSTQNQDMQGVTVVPGAVPIIGVPVTGDPTTGAIYIKKGSESNLGRLAFISAHELLGHMYQYIKNQPYAHGDLTFQDWLSTIESEANKNWSMMKKWEKSKQNCP